MVRYSLVMPATMTTEGPGRPLLALGRSREAEQPVVETPAILEAVRLGLVVAGHLPLHDLPSATSRIGVRWRLCDGLDDCDQVSPNPRRERLEVDPARSGLGGIVRPMPLEVQDRPRLACVRGCPILRHHDAGILLTTAHLRLMRERP